MSAAQGCSFPAARGARLLNGIPRPCWVHPSGRIALEIPSKLRRSATSRAGILGAKHASPPRRRSGGDPGSLRPTGISIAVGRMIGSRPMRRWRYVQVPGQLALAARSIERVNAFLSRRWRAPGLFSGVRATYLKRARGRTDHQPCRVIAGRSTRTARLSTCWRRHRSLGGRRPL